MGSDLSAFRKSRTAGQIHVDDERFHSISLVVGWRYPDAATSIHRHNPMYLLMLKHPLSQDPSTAAAECMRAGVDPKITHAL